MHRTIGIALVVSAVVGLTVLLVVWPAPTSDTVAPPEFSRDRGLYRQTFEVSLSSSTPGATIHYTMDGRAPTARSPAWEAPLVVDRTTCVRAIALRADLKPSRVVTRTFILLDDALSQKRPAEYPNGDYEMDPDVVRAGPFRDRDGELFDVADALRAIPTMSVVMDPAALFGRRGIYSNPGEQGAAWERPASIEYIDPAGSGFQVDCGIRMHGGWSRSPEFVKHSFRLYFRKRYGPAKLRYPLFPDTEVEHFDKLVLRAGSDDSWVNPFNGWMLPMAQYLRDQFARDTQRDMGRLAPHGRFVHLYLNGLYWGLYNCIGRPDADFLSAHLGGDDGEFDVIKTGGDVQDGDRVAWDTALHLTDTDLSSDAAYREMRQYIDVDNLIDYCLVNIYIANVDWPHNNWCTGRRRQTGAGFLFFSWDAEEVLYHPPNPEVDVYCDRTGVDADGSPGRLYARLRQNAEFRLRCADRAHAHFFRGGALTPEAVDARWMARAAEIDRAIVAESARWGDLHREEPFTRDGEWLAEQRYLRTRYFAVERGQNRSEIVLSQLRAAGLYPEVAAPRFDLDKSDVGSVARLTITAPESGVVYSPLVATGASCRVLVPANGALGQAWTAADFDDRRWIEGTTAVGYERQDGYEELIGTDVGDRLEHSDQSTFIRIGFEVAALDPIVSLRLKMRYDDGFVAYLNGVEIARRNAPDSPAWSSAATSDHEAEAYETCEVGDAARRALRAGANVLAIQGLNSDNLSSSDFLILPQLEAGFDAGDPSPHVAIHYTLDGTDPRLAGGAVAPTAATYTSPIALPADVTVRARVRNRGQWSALAEVGPLRER